MRPARWPGWIAIALVAPGIGSPAPPGGRGDAIEVPFRYESRSISLEARINGTRRLRMLFDTGWGPTTLDVRVARELGWIGPGEETGAVGERRLREFRLGSLVERDWPVDVADLSGINPPGLEPYDGVLGCSFLRDRIVQIDFAKRFLLTPQATEALGLVDSVAALPAVRSGFFSDNSARAGVARIGRLRRVRVGSMIADTARTIFGARGEGLMDQPLEVWGLIIGNGFLQDFLVTLDYRSQRVLLERQPVR